MRLAAGVTAQFHAAGGPCQWGSEGRRTLRRAEWTQWSLEPSEPMDTARPTVPLGNAGGGLRPTRVSLSLAMLATLNAGISRERCPGAWEEAAFPRATRLIFARAAVALSLSNQQQNPVRISVHVACRRGQDWYSLSGASGVLQVGELIPFRCATTITLMFRPPAFPSPFFPCDQSFTKFASYHIY